MEEPGADGTMDGLKEALSADQLHNHNDDEDPTPSFPAEEEEEICLDSGDEEEEILAPLRPCPIEAEPGAQKDAQAGLCKTTPPTEHSGRPPTGDEPGGAAAAGSGGGDCASSGDDLQPPRFSLPVGPEGAVPATRRTSGELEEGSPSVVEGTTEEDDLFTMEELNDSSSPPPPPAADVSQDVAPSNLSLEGLPESSPAPADGAGETGASLPPTRRPPEPSQPANGSAPNGPSAPSSSGSSGDSSPQTKPSRPAATTPTTAARSHAHALSSPYDTDCSRKLISEIQRSLSQESLLDDLESEILACRLPGGTGDGAGGVGARGPGGKGNHPVNGLPKEQQAEEEEEESMLENRVDELLKELREFRDKLLNKKCEEARQEKETMVMKYVRGEKEALDLRRDKESLEKKLREATKEEGEASRMSRELEKMKEEINSQLIKAKWAQNKLKSEADAHKLRCLEEERPRWEEELQKDRQEVSAMQEEVGGLNDQISELQHDVEGSREREAELLGFTEKLSSKNAQL
ncbi:hypothetical protein CRUP_002724, partial [Coryphaenoides rupestris]